MVILAGSMTHIAAERQQYLITIIVINIHEEVYATAFSANRMTIHCISCIEKIIQRNSHRRSCCGCRRAPYFTNSSCFWSVVVLINGTRRITLLSDILNRFSQRVPSAFDVAGNSLIDNIVTICCWCCHLYPTNSLVLIRNRMAAITI